MADYLGHRAADKTLSTAAGRAATILWDIITEQFALMEAFKMLLWTFYIKFEMYVHFTSLISLLQIFDDYSFWAYSDVYLVLVLFYWTSKKL